MRTRARAEVDVFAAVPAATRPIVEAARTAVLAAAGDCEAVACGAKKPKSPSMLWKLVRFSVNGQTVATIGTFTKHANMFFARGAELEDPGGILQGTGKTLRYLTLRTAVDARREAVAKVLRAAFALARES